MWAEPIMGAGGVIVPPKGYFPKIRAVLRKYDVLLVADEVICGFWRTGNYWGSQTLHMQPDIVTCAKALSSSYLPISAVMVNDRVFQGLAKQSHEIGTFGHGFTTSGHPLATAVALENLKILEERDLMGNAARMGVILQRELRKFAAHPLVGEVRGAGLIGGIELVADQATRKAFAPQLKVGPRAFGIGHKHGLIVRAIGDTLAVCPPLIITEAQINEVMIRLKKTLDETAAQLNAEGQGEKRYA